MDGHVQGFLYVLDCEGRSLAGWPLQMGDIQAQVAVGDINGDGALELVAADAKGNVAAFTAQAEELWERHVASLVAQVSAAPPLPAVIAVPSINCTVRCECYCVLYCARNAVAQVSPVPLPAVIALSVSQ